MMPLTKKAMFSPAPVTDRFEAEYSTAMALRPSQIRATSVDGAMMVPSAMSLHEHYGELAMPVSIVAGDGDKIVSHDLAERLHATIPGSTLLVIRGAGHMVHHVAPEQVANAIESVVASSAATFTSAIRDDGAKVLVRA
jgi:pimeloyl-ACP methyl ester carboxylesterase